MTIQTQLLAGELTDAWMALQRDSSRKATLPEKIDEFCQHLAYTIGRSSTGSNELKENPDLADIAWLTGQYRGTAISGKRAETDCWSVPGLASEDENAWILHLYWRLHGIGHSFGELFRRFRMVRDEGRSLNPALQWDVLVVSLARTSF